MHSKKNGYFFLQVKGNQPQLRNKIEKLFEAIQGEAPCVEYDRSHGREVVRTLHALSIDKQILSGHVSHVQQIYKIIRHRTCNRTQKTSDEIVYAISNATKEEFSPARMAQAARKHWHVENKLHWVKDVRMKEDEDRSACRHSAHNLGAIRNICLALLRQVTTANATPQQRWHTVETQPWRILKLLCTQRV